MRHLYDCPLRWADLDLLGHVNNVVYVDYLQEARIDMLWTHAPGARTPDLAEGVVVAEHRVTYLRPLALRERVAVECWVTEIRAASFTMAYELFDVDEHGEREVFLRATSLLTPYVFAEERPRRITAEERAMLGRLLEPPAERQPRASFAPFRAVPEGHWPCRVRFSDVDVYGHANNVKYFEYFQEARVAIGRRIAASGVSTPAVVVAQMDVDYRRPIVFRPEPYDAWCWVSRVGNSSYDVSAEIRDGDAVMARSTATMVTFDPATQRAAPATEAYRQVLRGLGASPA